METNPLVGFAAIAPDGAFLTEADCALVLGVSRKSWLQSFLTREGLGAWRVFPVFVNYLEPAITTGAHGEFALDGEAFKVFDKFALAKGRQPAGSFLLRFNGEAEDDTFFIYGCPLGLN